MSGQGEPFMRRVRRAPPRGASAAASRRSRAAAGCCLRARRRRRPAAPEWGRRRRAAARRRRSRCAGAPSRSGAPSGAAARGPRWSGRARAGSAAAAAPSFLRAARQSLSRVEREARGGEPLDVGLRDHCAPFTRHQRLARQQRSPSVRVRRLPVRTVLAERRPVRLRRSCQVDSFWVSA